MNHSTKLALPVLTLLSFVGVQPSAVFAAQRAQTAPETHPFGDIPDSQAFVRYASPAGGYSLEVPEGWARKLVGGRVTFTSKLNQVEVSVSPANSNPSVVTLRSGLLAELIRADPSVRVTLLKPVSLPAGTAILARFTSTGAANEVTGRHEVLENDLYVLRKGQREVVIRLSGPRGSDNVDAWSRIARSLMWR